MTADAHELIALMPFADQLGMTLEEASPDKVVALLPWQPGLCTMSGILHGGVLMSFADTTGAIVAFLGLGEGQITATITSTTRIASSPRPLRFRRSGQPASSAITSRI